MFAKNLSFFRLPVAIDPAELEAALHKKPHVPCSGLDWFTQGFAPVSAHAPDLMTHSSSDSVLLALMREDKVLPAGVIAKKLEERIAKIEGEEGRKIGRKEKQELKEQVTDDLLPTSHTKLSRTVAWVDNAGQWVVVDAGTASKAEGVVSAVREVLPPFPAKLVHTQLSPSAAMTTWLVEGAPEGFALDAECELRSPGDDGATIRAAQQDLSAEEIRRHVESGKVVTKLGLIWDEKIRFVLTDTLQLKKVQFLDVLQDEVAQDADDAAALFEATFTLMSAEVRLLLADLVEALGGEVSGQASEAEVKDAATPVEA